MALENPEKIKDEFPYQSPDALRRSFPEAGSGTHRQENKFGASQ